mmetsp:Transcript_13740/g.17333  ORF Transcript_13740/g.17333 Transcript_13740/m.17333 type:complete len:297 (+) Transcript_13740:88-978(+)
MSSLRNAVKRITHKERSQPTDRQHLGILEKKKDYRIRAADYHRKQDAITTLRRKASERNPDEFYFGMNRARVIKGRHVKDNNIAENKTDANDPEVVKLMKTQDLSYVRMQTLKDMKKVERLQASLHYLGDNPTSKAKGDYGGVTTMTRKKHTIFVDSQEKANDFDVADHFDTLPQLAGRSFNRMRKSTLIQMSKEAESGTAKYDEDGLEYDTNAVSEKQLRKQHKMERKLAKKISKARSLAYEEMEARKKRIELLKNTEAHLEVEKIVASKGRKRKIKGAEDGKPAIYKFRKKRAR